MRQAPATPVNVHSYAQSPQVRDAIRIKTMRGVWQLREYGKDGGVTEGMVTFRGSPLEERGRAVYAGDAAARSAC